MTAMTQEFAEESYREQHHGQRRRRRHATTDMLPREAANALAGARALTLTGAIIYIATAAVGVAVAFNPGAAFARFTLLALGLLTALAIVWLNGATQKEGVAGFAATGATWLAAALGAYFLLVYDWQAAGTAKFALLQAVGVGIQSMRPDLGIQDDANPNVMAGALVVLLTLGGGGLVWLWARQKMLALLTAIAWLFGAGVLLLTASRGGWLGLGAGALTGGLLWWRTGPGRHTPLRFGVDALLILLLGGLALSVVATLIVPSFAGPLGSLGVGGSAMSRAMLWRDTLPLIADYRFTGSGLTGTPELYSAYAFLLHVNFLTHAHNLFLQIALEQGLPGLIGFLALLGGTGLSLVLTLRHGDRYQRALAAGAAASLTALSVHGLADAGFYVSLLAPLMFLPFGVAWGVRTNMAKNRLPGPSSSSRKRRAAAMSVAAGIALPVAALILVLGWPGAPAGAAANLGAVGQSKAELSVYTWPEWGIQDELRRTRAVDLETAVARYSLALYLNENNGTANRRLGQMALSLGDLEAAERYLAAAHAIAPRERSAAQLLGEVRALQGQPADAKALWQPLNLANGQLNARQWWWSYVGTEEQERALTEAMR